MSMNRLALVLACAALAACAAPTAGTGSREVSASRPGEPLAGTWQGVVWETAPAYFQGQKSIAIRVGEDGAWRGTIGGQSASGVVRREHGRVVVVGTARGSDGRSEPVYYRLIGDDEPLADADRLWGEVTTTFGGRPARASVSLARVARGGGDIAGPASDGAGTDPDRTIR